MTFNVRTYEPPGPVGEAFLRCNDDVKAIMGPFGSGKTNLIYFDALQLAARMPPCRDGIRYFRAISLRDTYANLWKSSIKTWEEWFPQNVGQWNGTEGRAAVHKLSFGPSGGKPDLKFEMWFLALQEEKVENILRGIEFTWGHIGEADLVSENVLPYMLTRVQQRRYPPVRNFDRKYLRETKDGDLTPDYNVRICLDYNPPDVDNYLYTLFEETKPPLHRLFKQPSGRSPRGENRKAISREQYERMAETNAHRPDIVRRMVDGLYGYSRDGLPVYSGYQDEVHCVENLPPVPGVKLRLSFDQGVRGPAMLIRQFLPTQLRLIDEYVPGHRMGATAFAEGCRNYLLSEYPDYQVSRAVCDMAGFAGGDKEKGDRSWAEIVAAVLDLEMMPAPTNEIQARIDGVAQLLSFFPDGRPAFVMSSKCKVTRKGFNSHYRFKVDRKANTPDPVPEKNLYSNPHDALQYGVLDDFGLEGVLAGVPGGERGRGLKGQKRRAAAAPQDDDDDDAGGTVVANANFDVFRS